MDFNKEMRKINNEKGMTQKLLFDEISLKYVKEATSETLGFTGDLFCHVAPERSITALLGRHLFA
ncbi:hypothetical protein A5N86_08750 [Geobacillus thermoleovorans]|uniref:Uncharacterized protein n=1 Tax=Geobacillus thermoleovorans TaxID=33941 RepID=A0A2Z3N7E0_GEOTH|nr:hypothetical protein C1N76_09970 [Geobacillus thermoleovorans]KDE46691.1 hypothetical protein DI44_16115 [Geobacillus sp. CAMR5420]ODA17619.1 hypothetical protein A5N86_08750 [Geobacillus thermoleovorans]OQP15321.1 hypothetical protein B1693_14020 [Geobacillus zalihae]